MPVAVGVGKGGKAGRQNCNTRSGQALEESQRNDTQIGLGGAASSIAGFHFRLNFGATLQFDFDSHSVSAVRLIISITNCGLIESLVAALL